MTMKDYYKMSIGDGIDLRKEVEEHGDFEKLVWNPKTYQRDAVYIYKGDRFQIDGVLGIVDINDTAKEI